jgi:long-subunit fatty acid transport protein
VRAALICLIALGGTARAGGQYVADDGSAGLQRAGAFAAKADDPTALWYNPAAFALQDDGLFVGANVIAYDASFQRSGTYGNAIGAPAWQGDPYPTVHNRSAPVAVPMIAGAIRRDRLALGFGLMAPQGYGDRDYPTAVTIFGAAGAPAPQRYDVVAQHGLIVLPSVAGAYAVSRDLRVGVRASYGYASVSSTKVVQGVSSGSEDPASDSWVTIKASDTQVVTGALGVHYVASPQVELALTYDAPIHVHAVGTSSSALGTGLATVNGQPNYIEPVPDASATCRPGGARGAISSCVDFTLPQTATIAARYLVRDDDRDEVGDVELDVRWENWSAASDTTVHVDGQNHALAVPIQPAVVRHGFRDVWSVRLGASGIVDTAARRWHVRAGVSYDTAAAPDSWTRLDVDGVSRFMMAGGVGVELDAHWRLDVGGAVIVQPRRNLGDVMIASTTDPSLRVQPDAQVPTIAPDAQPYHPINAGAYESGYELLSLGLVYAW